MRDRGEKVGRIFVELHACTLGRPADRGDGLRLSLEEVETEPRFEVGRHLTEEPIQSAHVVLAHREQTPTMSVLEHLTDLVEELFLTVPVGRIQGKDLLELIEDEDVIGDLELFLAHAHRVRQRCRASCSLGVSRVEQTDDRAPYVTVLDVRTGRLRSPATGR